MKLRLILFFTVTTHRVELFTVLFYSAITTCSQHITRTRTHHIRFALYDPHVCIRLYPSVCICHNASGQAVHRALLQRHHNMFTSHGHGHITSGLHYMIHMYVYDCIRLYVYVTTHRAKLFTVLYYSAITSCSQHMDTYTSCSHHRQHIRFALYVHTVRSVCIWSACMYVPQRIRFKLFTVLYFSADAYITQHTYTYTSYITRTRTQHNADSTQHRHSMHRHNADSTRTDSTQHNADSTHHNTSYITQTSGLHYMIYVYVYDPFVCMSI
jgi:hypothetical protein